VCTSFRKFVGVFVRFRAPASALWKGKIRFGVIGVQNKKYEQNLPKITCEVCLVPLFWDIIF
jgi:hypothetical protein